MTKQTDKEALKYLLLTKQVKLNTIHADNAIAQALYTMECRTLQEDIDFIERQLENYPNDLNTGGNEND